MKYLLSRDYLVVSDWAAYSVGRWFTRDGVDPCTGASAGGGGRRNGSSSSSSSGRLTPRSSLLFDVGASVWDSGSGGPSQQYFVGQMQQQCLEVVGMSAWEAAGIDPLVVWSKVRRLCRVWVEWCGEGGVGWRWVYVGVGG
jgi:hypothetical protein